MAILLLALALFAGSACAKPSNRIVGGWPTTIEEYPSIVQVDSKGVLSGIWGQNCAANILTSRHVLSAAHCFSGLGYRRENRRIRAGATNRNEGGTIIYIVREFNHPSYGSLGNDGDITVVSLADSLVFNPVIQQARLVPQGFSVPDNLPVVHAGWGHTTQGGTPSPVLLETTIYTVNTEVCAERYLTLPIPRIVTENMICAGLLDEGGRDACQGDSGGPLYYNDAVQGDFLVGIVAWGHGCANDTYPGVNTRVASYTNWIIETIG